MAERARAEWAREERMVKAESWEDDGGRARIQKEHPLAGRRGEGAPLAPPGWAWRAGKRAKDMYFVSPSGDKFRSRLHLRTYLQAIPNSPPMSSFRWRVDPGEFEDGALPGVLSRDRKSYAKKKPRLDGASPPAVQFTVSKKDNFNFLQNSNGQPAHLSMRAPDMTEFSTKVGQKKQFGPDKINAKESDHIIEKETANTSFSHLLFTPTSYQVLCKDAEVLQRFLKEAALLKDMNEKEIGNLRNELLSKKYNSAQLRKYPDSVLRVFFYILRNEEAPAIIEKGQLIELCTNWICRHKHYWCLLETRRLDTMETLFSDIFIDSCRTSFNKFSTLKGKSGGFVQGEGGAKVFSEWKGTHDADGIPNDFATRSGVVADTIHGIFASKGVIESTLTKDEGEDGEALKDAGNVRTAGTGVTLTAVDSKTNVEGSCRSKETIPTIPGDFDVTPRSRREHTEKARQPDMHKGYKSHANKCTCQVCSSDPTFCYGCACNLCKVYIQRNQTWTFLNCPICQHFCHLECALKARRAGVVVELGMDGEYLCSCSNKSDLVPFWVEILKNALTSIDRSVVQKYLTSAVLVFNGTQRETFQAVHRSVVELHDSLLYNTPCANLQRILRRIQEKVGSLNSYLKRSDPLLDAASEMGADMQDLEFLHEEAKLREGLARADLHYAEWLTAEKNADTQRINLRIAQEAMEKAELDISTKASRARSSRTFIQHAERRLQFMKRDLAVKALSNE